MSKTNIEFINHASVLISCGKINLLSDPWYSGEVFHHGWRLIYELQDSRIVDVLKKTTHIYISHEHPDHFSPPFFLNKNIKKILKENNKIDILKIDNEGEELKTVSSINKNYWKYIKSISVDGVDVCGHIPSNFTSTIVGSAQRFYRP